MILNKTLILSIVGKKLKTYGVHLKVDEFSSSESDNDLALVDGTLHDGFLAWGLPFIYTLVSSDVTDAIRIYLRMR